MSKSFPTQDRTNDPEPYVPLLGPSDYSTANAHGSQMNPYAGGEQQAYYDRPPPGSPSNAAAYPHQDSYYDAQRSQDPYYESQRPQDPYFDAQREGRSPYEHHDPFSTQDSLQRDPYDSPYSQGLHDPSGPHGQSQSSSHLNPPPQQGHWPNNDDDIELRPINNKQSTPGSRFMPQPGPLSMKDTILFATGLDRVFRLCGMKVGESAEQVIQRRRNGLPGQRFPILAWSLTVSELLWLSCPVRKTSVPLDA